MYAIRSYARITSYNVCYTKLLRERAYRAATERELTTHTVVGDAAPSSASRCRAKIQTLSISDTYIFGMEFNIINFYQISCTALQVDSKVV